MAIIDTLSTLVHGGTLCIPSEEERLNDVESAFTRLRANEAFLTPSFARQLNPARMKGLRTLRTGAEPISKKDVELYAKYAEVITISGPAETSLCTSGVLAPGERMPPYVGHMINALSWVAEIDDETKLAPIGAVGQLLVEGPTVARGYHKQPELTEKAFIQVPDWLSDTPSRGSRNVYKSGDLVRYNSDGSLDIMGRRDGQVKIRGQRIELQEVEHHIDLILGRRNASLTVLETAVDLVRPKDDPEKSYLVAFLAVGSALKQPAFDTLFAELTSDLLQEMQSRLPPYMVPSACIPLENIPASAAKKTDRKALRAIGSERSTTELLGSSKKGRGVVEPATPMEGVARRLWAATLNIDEKEISVEDTFIRLGGDSIRAITLVSAAREQRITISVADVFRNPQLRELAKVMRTQEDTGPQGNQPIEVAKAWEAEIDGDLLARILKHVPRLTGSKCVRLSKCTPVQQGMLDARSSNTEIFQPHMSFTVKSNNGINICRFMQAWAQTVSQHEILRTALISLPGETSWYQYVLDSHYPEIHYIAGDSRKVYEQTEDLLEQQHLPPHQLLIRRKTDNEFTCTLHMSHALLEGGCIDELFNWLKRFYHAPEAALGTPTPQYYHFQQYLQTRPIEDAMDFWSKYLNGAQPCLLPSESQSDDSLQSFRSRAVMLPHSSRLRAACIKSGVTIPILIQSAWALTLHRLTRSSDVILGYVVSNRENVSTRDIIGTMLGILPRRLRISASEGLADVIQKCNDDWIECLPHQHLSFWEYYQRLHARSPHQTLFNTAINYRRFGGAAKDDDNDNARGDLTLGNVRSRDPFEVSV